MHTHLIYYALSSLSISPMSYRVCVCVVNMQVVAFVCVCMSVYGSILFYTGGELSNQPMP